MKHVTRALAAWLVIVCLASALQAAESDFKVEELKEAPQGLSAEVQAAINETGYRIVGKDGPICDVWLAKEVAMKPGFKSSLRVKYPFLTGALIGAIRYPEGTKPNDFRGQPFQAGTYTLRAGLQPDDGNHLGTSEIRDFLVACPPKADQSAKRIEKIKDLFKLSAQAAGTTHPTIFLLIPPPAKPFEAAAVSHDDEKKLVIFSVNATGKDKDKTVPIPISIVTIGKSAG